MDNKSHNKINFNIELGGISRKDILFFTRHLSIALKNGLTLEDGIEMIEEQVSSRKFKKLLGEIKENIRAGKPFYEALAHNPKYFSPIYVNLVKTGELSGALGDNLGHLAAELRKSQEMINKVKSAMTYPIMIFTAVIGLGLCVAWFILPKILPLFKTLEVDLPVSTKIMIVIADAFSQHGFLMVFGIIGGSVALIWLLRQRFLRPLTHRAILKFPIVAQLIRNIQLERFMRILETLLKSGISLDKGLKIVADASTNCVYQQAIESFIVQIEKGRTLSEGMGYFPALFPGITTRMVAMGEETGSLESTLHYLSEMIQEEIDNTLKNLSTILEPLLLIIIGLVVGTVAISILGPIYKITGSLRM